MASSASIAQEFYKVRSEWEKADKSKRWRLAIWVAQYQDVDIIDKFIETERLAVGTFDDIFFRFDTEYKGNKQQFEIALWNEYLEWFLLPENAKYDMYTALKNDSLLKEPYQPNTKLAPTFDSLLKELIRFKSCITGAEERNFCLYFPPSRPDTAEVGSWFSSVLKAGIPTGIRLITIDFAAKRKVKMATSVSPVDILELHPKLDMLAAINNEMDKAGGTYNTVDVEARFRKQIRVVMNNTLKKDTSITDKDIHLLLALTKEIGTLSAITAGLLIAAQAYFSIEAAEKCAHYADEALKKAEVAMEQQDPAGYPIWRSCLMLKGALLMGKKKLKQAISIYEQLAVKASEKGDAYFAMEGYRLSGHLYYEEKELQKAFETLLLALVAGSYLELEVRRTSTFLHAAYLALHIGEKTRTKQQLKTVEQELAIWLGTDWRELLQQDGVSEAKTKQKTSIFSSLTN